MSEKTLPPLENGKDKIAGVVTTFVLVATAVITIVSIIMAFGIDEKERMPAIKDILSMMLPLWGTWIGTILAYYFSKENFNAASHSVQQIVGKLTSDKKLESVTATSVMIPLEKLIYQEIKTGEDLSKFKLSEDCLDFVNAKGIKRIIILDENKKAKYVVHRDLISFFLSEKALAGEPFQGLTLKDMYDKGNKEIKETIDSGIKFVNKNANLFDAKQIMLQLKTCRDVFITETGSSKESVLGWITDVTINENSMV